MQTHNPQTQPDGRRAWLAALLLRQPDRFFPRLIAGLTRWRAMPCGFRRRLQRRVALSDAGLEPHRAKHNVNAFWIGQDLTGFRKPVRSVNAEVVILSFTQNARRVPDIEGKVDGMDLVHWDRTEFSLYFDGSDVGLTVKTQEKIDGLHVLPGSDSPINGGDCEAYLLISTHGPGKVPEFGGGVIRFDGSEEDMPRNSTDSISLSADGNTLYLTTRDDFEVDDAEGDDSDVYTYDFTTGEFAGPIFSAPDAGLHETVDGLHLE